MSHRGSRIIRATPAAIYAALTDPRAMEIWRAPAGMSLRVEGYDAVEGTAFRMTLTYDSGAGGKTTGATDVVQGVVGRLMADREVVEHVVFESDDPAFAGRMTVTTTLTPVDGGTEVAVRADDAPSGIGAEDHEKGIASTLANLAAHVE